MLDGQVPRVHRGETNFARECGGAYLIWKQELSRRWDRREFGCGRPVREIEYDSGIRGWIELLRYQYREVLCSRMPKVRTKHSNVKAASIAQPDHSLGCGLVGNAQTRRKVGQIILHISLEVDVAEASHIDQSGLEIEPTTSAFSRDRLRKINLPSQSIVKDQFARDTISVLPIKKPALLTFSGIVDVTYKPTESAYVAEQESGQAQAAAGWSLGARIEKSKTPRAGIGAGHAKVLRVAKIRAPFEGMVAGSLRPVGDPLKLPLIFQQRTAAVMAEKELLAFLSIHKNERHAGGKGVAQVYTRDPRIFCRGCSRVVR